MDELFPAEAVTVDSPRLAWIKKHGVLTWHGDASDGVWFAGFSHWHPGKTGIDFFAVETARNGSSRIGEGGSEDDAICDLLTCGEACAKGIKLWNEEA